MIFDRIDLCVSGDFDIPSTAKALAISKVGVPFDGKIREGVVYKLRKEPHPAPKYPYLIVSDSPGGHEDILLISDFHRVKEKLKRTVKKTMGLEATISQARRMDAHSVGKWFEDLRELYLFSRSFGCQFILSSGARSMQEMVSGPCFDAILKNCDIDPYSHWSELSSWLDTRLSGRIFT